MRRDDGIVIQRCVPGHWQLFSRAGFEVTDDGSEQLFPLRDLYRDRARLAARHSEGAVMVHVHGRRAQRLLRPLHHHRAGATRASPTIEHCPAVCTFDRLVGHGRRRVLWRMRVLVTMPASQPRRAEKMMSQTSGTWLDPKTQLTSTGRVFCTASATSTIRRAASTNTQVYSPARRRVRRARCPRVSWGVGSGGVVSAKLVLQPHPERLRRKSVLLRQALF